MQEFIWKQLPTRQCKEIIGAIADAKKKSTTAMIIAATGIGKTNGVNLFCEKNAKHTYRVTVSALYKKEDILDELEEMMDIVSIKRLNAKARLDRIAKHLMAIKKEGGQPVVIFDEGENMGITPLKMIKAFYDVVKGKCAIVLIGTDQLLNKIYVNRWKRNRESLPQLYRRFKAGLKMITPIDKDRDYGPFFHEYKIPVSLQKELIKICDNYGDFQDFLEPALMECKEAGKVITLEFFRIKHNLKTV